MDRKAKTFLATAAILATGTSGSLAIPETAQARELPAYLQCVPYAREVSGVRIFGDAHTWWDQAAARYQRGRQPRVGAVLAFRPHRNMRLGHVAAVSQVLDSRTVLLDHANWSPINGRRGQIERNVKAIDVSPANDWSEVRVWYAPLQALGKTRWPVHGFIYGNAKPNPAPQFAAARKAAPPAHVAAGKASSKAFSKAFASLGTSTSPAYRAAAPLAPKADVYRKARALPPQQASTRPSAKTGTDPFASVIARYD